MKTRYSIYMDYRKACAQADRLEALSASLLQMRNTQFNECLRQIRAEWESDHSNAYLSKANIVGGRISDTSRALKNSAATIRSIAWRTYRAEMAALDAARS